MRRTTRALATTFVAAATVALTAGPAAAGQRHPAPEPEHIVTSPYVAMGDSYSSAAGVNPLVPGSPPGCSRSLLNYAHDIARATGAAPFTDVTCSGARTSDFFTPQAVTPPDPRVQPQLDAVTKHTRFITMTIGGNDEGVFVDSFFGCAALAAGNPSGNPCEQKFGNTFVDEIRTQTYQNLLTALTAVHQKAPDATVAILGYPEILPEQGVLTCFPSMPIAMGDVPWLNHEEDVLNAVVEKAARETGTRFIDMGPASAGHDACQPIGTRWIEPATNPINAFPVHPNATGEAAMARQTLAQLHLRVTALAH